MKIMLKTVALAAVTALLVACGPNNPLIGQWESEPMMGMKNNIEFKSGAMINSSTMGGMSGSNETKVKEYKVEPEKVSVVLEQEGATATMTYVIIDDNTISQDLGIAQVKYHRMK